MNKKLIKTGCAMQILYECEYMYQRWYLIYLELIPFLPCLSSSFC